MLRKLLDQNGLMLACRLNFHSVAFCQLECLLFNQSTKSWHAQLGVLVTAINPAWNAPAASDLSVTSFLTLIFLTTQQKPTTCISQLRCGDSYLQLAKVLRKTFNKLKRSSKLSWPRIEAMLGGTVVLGHEAVEQVSREFGWQDVWSYG